MQLAINIFKKLVIGTTFVFAVTLSTLALGASPVLDRVVEQGVLKVAMSGDQQPFNFVFGNNRSLIGFDVDLAEALAEVMKVKLEIVQMPFGEILAAVESGEVDMAISGITITPSRTRTVSFVGPYMLSGKSMLTTKKLIDGKKDSAEFNNASVKLAALKGSTSESFVQRNLPDASLVAVENYDAGVQQLLGDKVDGLVADMPILALTRQQHPDADLQLVMPPLSTEPLGIAIAMNDSQFENLLRNYLLAFEKTGLFINLHLKWFEIGNRNIYEP